VGRPKSFAHDMLLIDGGHSTITQVGAPNVPGRTNRSDFGKAGGTFNRASCSSDDSLVCGSDGYPPARPWPGVISAVLPRIRVAVQAGRKTKGSTLAAITYPPVQRRNQNRFGRNASVRPGSIAWFANSKSLGDCSKARSSSNGHLRFAVSMRFGPRLRDQTAPPYW